MCPSNDSHPLISLGMECFTPDLHSSNVAQYRACPRKFMLSEMFHLRPKGYYAPALHLGGAFHKYMEMMTRTDGDEGLTEQAVAELQLEAMAQLAKDTNEFGLLPNSKNADPIIQAIQQDTDKARVMAGWLWRHSPMSTEKWEVLGVEKQMRVSYKHSPVPIRGALDLVLKDVSNGEVWIMDYKTTSRNTVETAAQYRFDLQPMIYRKLAQATWPDENIVGVCHTLMFKPTIKQKQKQSWEEYIEEMEDYYDGKGKFSTKWDNYPPVVRSWVRFDDHSEDELNGVLAMVGSAAKMYPSLPDFPRRSQSCMDYNKICPYLDLCSVDPITWGTVVPLRFDVKHRDDDTSELEDLT